MFPRKETYMEIEEFSLGRRITGDAYVLTMEENE